MKGERKRDIYYNEMKEKTFKDSDNVTRLNFVILAILFGLISGIVHYRFGVENHIPQLPIVMRAIDNSFLSNDFFVNSTTDFPRFYYAKLIGFLASITSLSITYFFLTAISNILVAVITYLFTRELFDRSDGAGILSASVVMSLGTFALGSTNSVFYISTLDPPGFVLPLLLLALWGAMKDKPLICGLLAGIASLFHPLLGLGTGMILLFMLAVSSIYKNGIQFTKFLSKILISIVILIILATPSLFPYFTQKKIDSEQFINILAFFRNPHHYVPSTFGLNSYVLAIAFLATASLVWQQWRKSFAPKNLIPEKMLIISITLLLLCIGGWLFVEVLPMRIWVSAQVFRFLFLIKWLGMILISGRLGYSLLQNSQINHDYVKLVSLFSPITMFYSHFAEPMRIWSERHASFVSVFFKKSVVFIATFLLLLILEPNLDRVLVFSVFFFLIYAFNSWPKTLFYLIVLVGIMGLIFITPLKRQLNFPAQLEVILDRVTPQFAISPSSEEVELVEYVQNTTSKHSIFLTPPNFGKFRLTAQRAIVVDFKSFPFQDTAMLEWQQRLFDSYGVPSTTGFAAAAEMEENYRLIDDSKLKTIAAKYDFDYVVLFAETKTDFPVVFENQSYKIIFMP